MAIDLGAIQTAALDIGVIQSAASSSINETISDSLTISDGISILLTLLPAAITDSVTFSDNVNVENGDSSDYYVSIADTLSISDTVELGLIGILSETATDSITFTDALAGGFAGIFVSVSDTLTLLDNWNYLTASAADSFSITDALMGMLITIVLNVSDTLSITDSFNIIDQDSTGVDIYVPALVDSLTFTDGLNSNVGIPLVESDALSFSDTVQLFGADLLHLSDSITFTDAVMATIPLPGLSFTDFFSFADRITVQTTGTFGPAAADTLSFTDSIFYGLNTNDHNESDALSFSDAIFERLDAALDFTDSLTISDALEFAAGNNQGPSDTVSLSDSVQLELVAIINLEIADSFAFSDTIEDSSVPPPTINLAFGDGLTLVDTVMEQDVQFEFLVDATDSLSLSDGIDTQLTDALHTFQDSIEFSDSVQLNLAEDLNSYLRRYLNDVI